MGSVALVGRSAEQGRLAELVAEVQGGRGHVLLIEGEAGIGKTCLLGGALHSAHQQGFRVFYAAAQELERRRPFGAISDCLGIGEETADAGWAHAARLLSGPGVASEGPVHLADAPEIESRAVEALLDLVEEICGGGPLVIAIDDLQWADPSTLRFLHRLARCLPQLPALLACTCRPLPRGSELERLVASFQAAGAAHLVLRPLERHDVNTLLEALIGAAPGGNLLQEADGAGGNPFFIGELVAAFRSAGALHVTPEGKADIGTAVLPSTLTLTVLHELGFLSEETRGILQAASFLDSRFEVTDLSAFLGRPTVDLIPALQESMAAGILVVEGSRLAFRHGLIRESLYQDLPLAIRTALHMDVARALAAAGAPTARLAEHLMRGAAPGDEEALEWLTRAAREVARQAPGVAAEMFERAGEVAGWSHPSYSKLLAEQALCLSWSGQSRAAEAICREALARGVDHPEEATLHLSLVQSLVTMGRLRDALRHASEAMESENMCEASRARLLAWVATCRLSLVDLEGAAGAAVQAQRVGEAAEDLLTRCICTVILAWIAHQRGQLDAAMELSANAVRLADASPAHEAHRFPVLLLRGLILIDLDRAGEAQAVIAQGRRIAEESGIRGTLPAYLWASALAHFAAGAWDDADAECVSALELSAETGMRQGALFAHAIRCLIALHRNDLKAAARAAAAGEREFETHKHLLGLDWMMWARGLLAEAEGDPGAALAILSNAWDALCSLGLVAGRPLLGPDLVRLARIAGDPATAGEVVKAMEEMARSAPDVAAASRAALACRGLLDAKPAPVLEAVCAYRAAGRPLELALACEDAAGMLRAQDRAAEARPLLEEALRIYRRLDASRGIARVANHLRALGLRHGRQGRRNRPRSGWESLTQAELKVAGLVAVGLSNPQIAERLFLSRPTVRTHVSHILAKLNVSSRVALAAEVTRRRSA